MFSRKTRHDESHGRACCACAVRGSSDFTKSRLSDFTKLSRSDFTKSSLGDVTESRLSGLTKSRQCGFIKSRLSDFTKSRPSDFTKSRLRRARRRAGDFLGLTDLISQNVFTN